ncbi:MAG: CDP-diacylglycerol O-phosphatidyltransferase [Bacteroidales bacterium]|nr:CDP-diacylglycerol O-phosphatidyltransferase [Bacteroidales bacterium]
MIRHIPNTLTLLNLVAGFVATICAIKGYNEYASFCIIAGMVLDFSDGFAARLLKAWSDIGKDLDSLADVVTFGVAPGAIVFNLLSSAGLSPLPAGALAAMIPAASALRLAKFNNDTSQKNVFRGMATPAAAFTVVSVVLASSYSGFALFDRMVSSPLSIALLALFLAVMMLLRIRMFSLKFTSAGWKGNEERYLFVAVSLLLLFIFRMAALPMIIAAYIIISLFFPLLRGGSASAGAA